MPERLGWDLRSHPLIEALVPQAAVIGHVVSCRIVDVSERVIPHVGLGGRDEHEGAVPVRGLPHEPFVQQRAKESA